MKRLSRNVTSVALAIALAGSAFAGGVMINMPAPKKAAKPLSSPAAASASPIDVMSDVDAGQLALRRYAGARSLTSNTYTVGGRYHNWGGGYSSGYSHFWGFPLVTFSRCGNKFTGTIHNHGHHHHHGSHCD